MKKNPIIFTLKSFSAKERRDFKKWLLSPVHNQREDIISLTDYFFYKNHLLDDKFLKKERVFAKIFPKEQYNDAKMRQTIHFLNKKIEDFLIYNELKDNEIRAGLALASVYRKKNLSKAFHKTMKNVIHLQNQSPLRNEHFLRNEYLIQKEQYQYFEKQQRNVKLNLQEMSDALDMTYFADKLRQSCLMLSHQKVFKTEYKPALINKILEYVEQKEFNMAPAVSIYYYVYMALTKPEDRVYFDQLKKNIFELGHTFLKSEIRDIYLMAINYCIGKINAGEISFRREAFDLNKRGVETGVLIQNNSISPWTFINIIANSIQLKEFDWTYNFIETYQSYIPASQRENFTHYGYASYHFFKKEYDEAMDWLIRTDFSDTLLNLNAKMLLLKIYYEKDAIKALESLLESTRKYIHRKGVVGYPRTVFLGRIKMIQKLVRVNPYSRIEKNKLKDEMLKEVSPLEREWLLAQLAKLN